MLIQATPRDQAGLIALLPPGGGTGAEPGLAIQRAAQLIGSEVPGPDGVTVRYEGLMEFRGVDIAPVLQFLMDAGAGVSATLIARWIIGKFRGRVDKLTINRRQIDLDDEGQVRRIVEEEIKVDPR